MSVLSSSKSLICWLEISYDIVGSYSCLEVCGSEVPQDMNIASIAGKKIFLISSFVLVFPKDTLFFDAEALSLLPNAFEWVFMNK